MDLKTKVVKGVKWNAFSQFMNQAFQMLIMIILARLLNPGDFGLMSMVLVFTGFIYLLNDFGLSSAIIQKQNLNKIEISNIFWLSLLIGFILTLITVGISPLIAKFYNKVILKQIVSLVAIGIFITSVSSVPRSLLMKELMFKKLAFVDILSNILSGSFAIILAYSGFGIWSLASRMVVQPLISGIVLFIYSSYIPVLSFKMSQIKPIMSYSLNMVSANSVNYFSRNSDNLLIGKFIGAEALGYYALAYQIMLFPVEQLGQLLLRTMFPALSKLQNDTEQLKQGFIKTAKYVALVSFPLMIGLFVLSSEFILIFFGDKWSNAILLLKVFCIVGLIQSIGTLVPLIYLPLNKPNLLFKWNIFATLMVLISIVFGLRWNLIGVTVGYTLVSILLFYPSLAIPFRLINLKFIDFIKQFRSIALAAVVMGIITSLTRFCLVKFLQQDYLLILSLTTLTGVITYSVVLLIVDSFLCRELLQLLSESNMSIKLFNKIFRIKDEGL